MLFHATCIAIGNHGVLLTGTPGSGKSDLALRLIDAGAQLVADDQVELHRVGEALVATAPAPIAGMVEVRHVGLLHMPHRNTVPVTLYVSLVSLTEKLKRLPDLEPFTLLDCAIRQLRLPAYAASTPAKIRAALAYPLVTDSP